MDFIPDFYKDIPLGTYDQTPGSPEIPSSTWEGIIISGPERVIPKSGELPILPICGYYLVPVLKAMDGPPLTVHVGRIDSDLSISGEIVEEGGNEPLVPPPPDAPRPSRELFEGVSTGGYFNVDAQKYLQIRLSPGTYQITVSYADATSNPIRIDIAAPK